MVRGSMSPDLENQPLDLHRCTFVRSPPARSEHENAAQRAARAVSLESSTLDFKTVGRSRNDALEDLAEAMACFANTAGGTVVVGVADSGSGPDALVGCDLEPERTKHRIFELTNPGLVVSAAVMVVEGVSFLVLVTPSSPTVHAVRGRSHERLGTSCVTMSPARIAAVVAERRGDDWSAEDSGTPFDQVDPVAIAQCRAFLAAHPDRASRGYAEEPDRDVLRLLGVVTNHQTLTNAAHCCSRGEPIMPSRFPMYSVEHPRERWSPTSSCRRRC